MIIILIIVISTLLFCCIYRFKINNAYKNQKIICDAIFEYSKELIKKGNFKQLDKVTFEDMRSYDATLYRFWDWGYKKILPAEKFELIKPFITEVEK